MAYTNPDTRSVDDIFTAAEWNTQIRDNLNFLHDTHGPLWIPAQMWSDDASYMGTVSLLGTGDDRYIALSMIAGIDTNRRHHSVLVPDDWIAGGFTVKVHWTPADGTAGNVRFTLAYLFVSAGEDPRGASAVLTQDIAAGGSSTAEQIDTIGTTSAPTAGEWMKLVLNRLGAHANDTYAAAANITGLELEYT